ncbi:MAG: hypothetical protein KGL39_09615 [Patescibacteria group bacterium]|nr:hypothetical protein [Patescibacteria group bacterium]
MTPDKFAIQRKADGCYLTDGQHPHSNVVCWTRDPTHARVFDTYLSASTFAAFLWLELPAVAIARLPTRWIAQNLTTA